MYKNLPECTYKTLYRTRWDTTEGHHKVREVTVLFHFHMKVIAIKQVTYADNLSLILLHRKNKTTPEALILWFFCYFLQKNGLWTKDI